MDTKLALSYVESEKTELMNLKKIFVPRDESRKQEQLERCWSIPYTDLSLAQLWNGQCDTVPTPGAELTGSR